MSCCINYLLPWRWDFSLNLEDGILHFLLARKPKQSYFLAHSHSSGVLLYMAIPHCLHTLPQFWGSTLHGYTTLFTHTPTVLGLYTAWLDSTFYVGPGDLNSGPVSKDQPKRLNSLL